MRKVTRSHQSRAKPSLLKEISYLSTSSEHKEGSVDGGGSMSKIPPR